MGSLCMEVDSMDELLIPGLPNHLALLCLGRVPRIHHGFLRGVNSVWRAALSSPDFFHVRACQGWTEESILIVSEQHLPATEAAAGESVQCVELSLGLGLSSHVMASWTHKEAGKMFLRGQACAQAGPAVLFAGGYTQDEKSGWAPTGRTWRLCVMTWHAHEAACMRMPRASFAWAVFGMRLVAAGGERMLGEWTAEVEAYDFSLDVWLPLKPIPKAIKIHSYFTQDGQLFIRGWDQTPGHVGDNPTDNNNSNNFSSELVFSYHPDSDTWTQEEQLQWMGSLRWDPCCVTVTTGPPGNAVICASLRTEATLFGDEFLSTSLRIHRISPMPPIGGNNSNSSSSSGKVKLKWETVDILDRICTPSVFSMHGCSGKAVLVLPYDLAGIHRRHSACLLAKERGQDGPDIVLKNCAPDLIEVCVRCCYCIRCCLTSALITL